MIRFLRLTAVLLILVGFVCSGLYFSIDPKPGALHWQAAVVKKSLMTFAFKVWAAGDIPHRFFP